MTRDYNMRWWFVYALALVLPLNLAVQMRDSSFEEMNAMGEVFQLYSQVLKYSTVQYSTDAKVLPQSQQVLR